MLQRLQIEWMKLKSYRTFWILLSMYLLCIVGINYIVFFIQQKIYEDKKLKGMGEMLIGIPYSFPTVWQMTAYVSSFLLFFPGILMIISMSNEYSYKTHRQNIIDGWNRREFITVKMALVIILALISTIMVIPTAMLYGFAEGSTDFSLDGFINLFYFFVMAVSYTMVALFIAVLVKRGALAIGIYFLYALIVDDVISRILNYYFDTAGRYLPLQSFDLLIRAPVFEQVQKQFSKPINYTALFIVEVIYLFAFFFFTFRKFERDDL